MRPYYERPSRWVTTRGFLAELAVFAGGVLLILGIGFFATWTGQ